MGVTLTHLVWIQSLAHFTGFSAGRVTDTVAYFLVPNFEPPVTPLFDALFLARLSKPVMFVTKTVQY